MRAANQCDWPRGRGGGSSLVVIGQSIFANTSTEAPSDADRTMSRAIAVAVSSVSSLRPRRRCDGRRARPSRATNDRDAIAALRELANGRWNVGEYASKRREHLVTELGDIIGEEDALENIAEQPGWDEEGKMRFCVRVVADELGLGEAECGARLGRLFTLAPGLERRVLDREVRMADIVRMAANVPDIALAFVRLKEILPEADLSKLVQNKPAMLLKDPADVRRKVDEFREKCPKLRWDLILSDFTQLWDVRDPAECVDLLKDKLDMNDDEVQAFLGQRPDMLLSVLSRHDMISYDNGTLAQVQATLAGDRFSDGW